MALIGVTAIMERGIFFFFFNANTNYQVPPVMDDSVETYISRLLDGITGGPWYGALQSTNIDI